MKRLYPHLLFLGAWTLINVALNLRYPGSEPKLWYVLPSLDTIWMFSLLGLVQWSGRQVPRGALAAGVGLIVLARVIRLGDGLQEAYYSQRFSLYTDLPLAPELVRFAHSTLPWWKFWPLILACIAGFVGSCWLLFRALQIVQRYVADQRHYWVFAGIAAAVFLIGLPIQHRRHKDFFRGGLAASIGPRLQREVVFALDVSRARKEHGHAIARLQQELERMPHDLAKLGGADVHLIVIESYGRTVIDRPMFKSAIAPVFSAIESELGAKGFQIASGLLDSSTYGGHSWLAHATIGTGVRTSDQLQYDVVTALKPRSLASFFRAAGYRTVLAQPGTTRPWPKGEFYRFDKKYYLWDFDYAGPEFAWATMPDQYVLDFMRRRELAARHGPLFMQYVLVSSHAPWSDVPTLVDDWDAIGNGALYHRHPAQRFPIKWPDFSNAAPAYIQSIIYDFEVLKRYIGRFIEGDALVILVGDHQPVWDVNGGSPSHGVPIHVLSRNAALVAPFQARGYARGMWPGGPTRGLERFLPDLLRDFSTR